MAASAAIWGPLGWLDGTLAGLIGFWITTGGPDCGVLLLQPSSVEQTHSVAIVSPMCKFFTFSFVSQLGEKEKCERRKGLRPIFLVADARGLGPVILRGNGSFGLTAEA